MNQCLRERSEGCFPKKRPTGEKEERSFAAPTRKEGEEVDWILFFSRLMSLVLLTGVHLFPLSYAQKDYNQETLQFNL
jgi:hypothetical protein